MKRFVLAAALAATTPALADDAGALTTVTPADLAPTFQANALENTPFGVNTDALKAPATVDTGALSALLQNAHGDALKAAGVIPPAIKVDGCPVLEETATQNTPTTEEPYPGQRFTF